MNPYDELLNQITNCARCPLASGRKHTVPGEGNLQAGVMLVGEGPGADEDASGRPFVGKAGQLLDQMLEFVKIDRNEVYIANVIKCRPPGNRNPLTEEIEACLPFLRRQVQLIKPRLIVCMGSVAAKAVMDPEAMISRIRGEFLQKKDLLFFATYHPAALLRNDDLKWDSWRDFKRIKAFMDGETSVENEEY